MAFAMTRTMKALLEGAEPREPNTPELRNIP